MRRKYFVKNEQKNVENIVWIVEEWAKGHRVYERFCVFTFDRCHKDTRLLRNT